jgi:stage III sporulation protein AA
MFAGGIKEELFKYFPESVMKTFLAAKDADIEDTEEIRLRAGKPAMLYRPDGACYITTAGQITRDLRQKCLYLEEEDLKNIFFSLAKHSVYAYEAEIKNGFITIDSGYRVGLAGTVINDNGRVKGFKNINALNIRIPRQLKGISKQLLKHISEDGRLLNTLVISAPQLGKTTLIRDIARAAGNGEWLKKHKVTIVDERGELAALKEGSPQFSVGLETDVLDGVLKSEGILMALRSLSPDVIITDEIGREADLGAIREALNSGVTIVATAHGSAVADLKKRLFFNKLFLEHAFERLVVLSGALGKITVGSVLDDGENALLKEPLLLKV